MCVLLRFWLLCYLDIAGALQKAAQSSKLQRDDASICIFVRSCTVLPDCGGRERLEGVASTWAAAPAIGTKVFYMIDEQTEPYHVPAIVNTSQIVRTPYTPYQNLTFREKFMLELLNTETYLRQCNWMVLADDDTYVNSHVVARILRSKLPTEPQILGRRFLLTAYRNRTDLPLPFIHGSFRAFSKAAIPPIVEAIHRCNMPNNGFEDGELAICLKDLGIDEAMIKQDDLPHELTYNGDVDHLFDKVGEEIAAARCNRVYAVHKLSAKGMPIYHALISLLPLCDAL